MSNNRNKYLFIVVLVFVTFNAFAKQNTLADSLTSLLQTETIDTNRVKLLIKLGETKVQDTNHVLPYARQAINLANKNKYSIGEAKANLLIGRSYMRYKEYNKAREYFLKSIPGYKQNNNWYGLTRALNNVCLSYFKQKNTDSSKFYAQKSIPICTKHNYFDRLGFVYATLGLCFEIENNADSMETYFFKASQAYDTVGNYNLAYGYLNNIGIVNEKLLHQEGAILAYTKAKDYCISKQMHDKAIKSILSIEKVYRKMGNYSLAAEVIDEGLIYSKNNNLESLHKLYQHIALQYQEQGMHSVALEYYHKALMQVENDSSLLKTKMHILDNLADTHLEMQNHDDAMNYFEQALKIAKNHLSIEDVMYVQLGIARIYSQQGKLDKNIALTKEIIKNGRKLNLKGYLCSNLSNLGSAYLRKGELDSAYTVLQEALTYAFEIKSQIDIAKVKANLARYHLAKENYNTALRYANESYEIRIIDNNITDMAPIHFLLYKIHYQTGAYKNACDHYVEHKQLRDSLLSISNLRKTTTLELEYNFDKERELKEYEQKQKDILQQKELERQRIMRNSFVLGFLLMTILAIVALRSFIQKRKSNNKLSLQKTEIEAQAIELNSKNKKLVELDSFKENMTGMIVHDLKNPLNTIVNTATSISAEKQITIMKQAGKQMLNMVMNILDVHKYEETQMLLDMGNYSLINVINTAISEVALLAQQKSIEIKMLIDSSTSISCDKEIIERVIVNILTNAIKYTPNNGIITINNEIDEIKQITRISINDTGQGIPANKIDKIFDKFAQIDARKSGKIRSSGLGLTFCKMAIEAHDGIIGAESIGECGTTFWFTIKLGKQIKKESIEKTSAVEKYSLSNSDKQNLLPYISNLQNLMVYEITDIMDILSSIDNKNSNNIMLWKDDVTQAVMAMNEDKYYHLISL